MHDICYSSDEISPIWNLTMESYNECLFTVFGIFYRQSPNYKMKNWLYLKVHIYMSICDLRFFPVSVVMFSAVAEEKIRDGQSNNVCF